VFALSPRQRHHADGERPCAGPDRRAGLQPAMRRPHRRQGFTLIEVLVALTLLALLSLISWRGLDAMQQGGERLDARAQDILSIVNALSQLERDMLLHASADVLPPVPPPPADQTSSAEAHPRLALPGIAWA